METSFTLGSKTNTRVDVALFVDYVNIAKKVHALLLRVCTLFQIFILYSPLKNKGSGGYIESVISALAVLR